MWVPSGCPWRRVLCARQARQPTSLGSGRRGRRSARTNGPRSADRRHWRPSPRWPGRRRGGEDVLGNVILRCLHGGDVGLHAGLLGIAVPIRLRGEDSTQGRPTMKAIVVTDQAAGTAGMTLVDRPEPQAAINDVVVQIHASGFVPTEMAWPSTWTDRLDRDRTPSIPGHELAGVVTALGYGTTGLSVGQRVFGLTDWTRDGTLAEYAAVEARNLAPLPGDVDFTAGAALVMPGLTA